LRLLEIWQHEGIARSKDHPFGSFSLFVANISLDA
jgi:hypothetical protein